MKYAAFTKSLSVAFSETVYRKIRKIADDQRISMSDFVRAACEKALDEIKESQGGNK